MLKTSKTGRGIHADEGGQPGPQRRWLHRRALPGPALVVRDVLRGEEEGKSFFFFRKSLRKGGGTHKIPKKKLKMKKQAEVREVVRIGYLNGLFVLARAIGLIGHALDQQRLRQPLYRHPW